MSWEYLSLGSLLLPCWDIFYCIVITRASSLNLTLWSLPHFHSLYKEWYLDNKNCASCSPLNHFLIAYHCLGCEALNPQMCRSPRDVALLSPTASLLNTLSYVVLLGTEKDLPKAKKAILFCSVVPWTSPLFPCSTPPFLPVFTLSVFSH